MNKKRIEEAVANAQLAFWAEIAKSFPEATTGDFPVEAEIALDRAMLDAATTWCGFNCG